MNALPLKLGCWQKCDLSNITKYLSLARVGHTAHHLQVEGNLDWLLLVGGANLFVCCKNALLVNLKMGHVFSVIPPDSLPEPGIARYEHSSCIYGNELLLFGGATVDRPINDLLQLSLRTKAFTEFQLSTQLFTLAENSVEISKIDIAPRTQHSSNCLTSAGEVVIFAGGNVGSMPVEDPQVHVYEVKTRKWRTVEIRGEENCIPQRRMGHLLLTFSQVVNHSPQAIDVLYIHGGMAGNDFFDDFYCLRLDRISAEDGETRLFGEWQNMRNATPQGSFWPVARAGHGGAAVVSNSNNLRFFIFGGINSSGPLNDLHYFDDGSKQWTTVTRSNNMAPSPRLDFAFTTLRLKVPNPSFDSQAASVFSTSTSDGDKPKNAATHQGRLPLPR